MPNKKPDTAKHYDAFIPDPTSLTPEEVEAELADAEPDAAAVRASVAEMAQELAADLRKAGIPASPVLKDVAAIAKDDALPRDEKLARSKAAARVADLERRRDVPRDFSLLEAARKGPAELTSGDRDLLDSEAEELRKEIEAENDEAK